MTLKYVGIKIELREVELNDLPTELQDLSADNTVPILVLSDGTVFSDSWDIIKWALSQNDPDGWLGQNNEHVLDADILIETNDFSFKEDLDHYKYSVRYPEESETHYREACQQFIEEIEAMLADHVYLLSNQITLADIGIFPFIRQFSLVNKVWFDNAPYPKVQQWLNDLIDNSLFQTAFQKHDLWSSGNQPIYI